MWRSKAGGLYFTMVLRPRIEPALSGRINFYAAAILAKILRESYGVTAAVKWPNDILVAEKKLAGLLAEMEADSDRVNHINIGCGININNTPKTEEPGAVSLKQLIGRRVSRREVLAAFLNAFENEFDHSADVSVIDMWKSYNVTLNRQVKVVTIREELEGLAVDVDTNGALILKQEDGSLKTVFYGDCFHHRTR
jgi:BirA family biotin operon repressor/biotin-[acetyl-CoA-carboxylase] ligase